MHIYITKHIHSFLRLCVRSDKISALLKQKQIQVKTKTVSYILHKNYEHSIMKTNLTFKMSILKFEVQTSTTHKQVDTDYTQTSSSEVYGTLRGC